MRFLLFHNFTNEGVLVESHAVQGSSLTFTQMLSMGRMDPSVAEMWIGCYGSFIQKIPQ